LSGAIGALLFVVGVLIIFAIGFDFFLVVPFFIFIIGIIAMFVSDRKRSPEQQQSQENAKRGQEDPV
jgi:uncharacterized membrane protein